MAAEIVAIRRPQRWDVPYGPDMTEADVARVLTFPPFNRVDASRFPASLPLPGILRNDARVRHFAKGDIIVRAGDYLNSAFFILSGNCRVEMGPGESGLQDAVLGRRKPQRMNLFQLVAQLWHRHQWPEVRDPSRYVLDERVARRGFDAQTRIYLQDVQAVLDTHRTVQLGPGQSFGETAALSRTPRDFTIFTENEAELVEVRWQGLRDLFRRDAALRQHAEGIFRERALSEFLANSPLFRHLQPVELEEVGRQAVFDSYGAYDKISSFRDVEAGNFAARLAKEPIIASEGNYGNGLFMIRNGVVRVSKRCNNGERTVSYLTPGQAYGFDEMAANWQKGAPLVMKHTLRAVGYVNVILVPTAAVEQYVRRTLPGARMPLEVIATEESKEQQQALDLDDHADAEVLEFLVENRFVTGTASMVIDLNRCTRCDDCVRACAAAHDNNPRFLRHGPTNERYMVANACMHCMDPLCMIECPTGAVHRDQQAGVVVINDVTCIGCSACAHNCPYDAIRMVEIRDAHGNFLVDQNTNAPIAKATKCDLCIDQRGGPACQRACPHDALERVDMRNLNVFARWLHR